MSPADRDPSRRDLAWIEAEVRARGGSRGGPAHLFDHVDRVRRLALFIARWEPEADPSVLEAAALLHDLGRIEVEPEGSDHAERGAGIARQLLTQRGWSADRIEAVAHAVWAHSYSARRAPETIEARILQDADRLDALGAVGIARVIAHDAQCALYDPNDPLAERRPPDGRFVVDHFRAKILRLKYPTCYLAKVAGRNEDLVWPDAENRFYLPDRE